MKLLPSTLFQFGSVQSLSRVRLFMTPWIAARQASLSMGRSSFSILSFCLFILFMGFSRQEYWSGLPFPSPVDHILSDLSTMTRPSWVAPRAWLSFIEFDKAVVLVWLDWLVFCEYFPGGSDGKASAYNVGDLSSIPRLGRSLGERNGNPLQCSCLENPTDRGGTW